jgi:hypothetical protein
VFSKKASKNTDYLASSYIVSMGFQFSILAIDRVLYLCRWIKLKTLLHWALVVGVFYTQYSLQFAPYTDPYDIAVFILDCIYLFFSAMQISYGYADLVAEDILTRYVHWFAGYVTIVILSIPLVYEMKVILDWTCSATTLYIYEWMQVEDINISLYITACGFDYVASEGRYKGQPQPLYRKFLVGALGFLGLIILLWTPLLLFSSINPTNAIQPVKEATISIAFGGYPVFYDVGHALNISETFPVAPSAGTACNSTNPRSWKCIQWSPNYSFLRYLEPSEEEILRDTAQFVDFPKDSGIEWIISPPTKESLIADLLKGKMYIEVMLSFEREYVTNKVLFKKQLDLSERVEVLRALGRNVTLSGNHTTTHNVNIIDRGPNKQTSHTFRVSNMIPKVVKLLPSAFDVTVPTSVTSNYFRKPAWDSCNFTIDTSTEKTDTDARRWISVSCGDYLNAMTRILTFSSRYVLITGYLSASSILGFYVVFIYTAAKFIRSYFFGLRYELMYCSMPVTHHLRQILKDLYLARMLKDLKSEEELYRTIVDIYRRPDVMMKYTGGFQHWFPDKKLRMVDSQGKMIRDK